MTKGHQIPFCIHDFILNIILILSIFDQIIHQRRLSFFWGISIINSRSSNFSIHLNHGTSVKPLLPFRVFFIFFLIFVDKFILLARKKKKNSYPFFLSIKFFSYFFYLKLFIYFFFSLLFWIKNIFPISNKHRLMFFLFFPFFLINISKYRQ